MGVLLVVMAILLLWTIWLVATVAEARLKLADVVERKGADHFIKTGEVSYPWILLFEPMLYDNVNSLPTLYSLALCMMFPGALAMLAISMGTVWECASLVCSAAVEWAPEVSVFSLSVCSYLGQFDGHPWASICVS